MKSLLYCAAVAIVSMSLAGQTTGRIQGKVVDSAGKPIPKASIVLKRLDITSVREIKVDARGNFVQVGLHPTEFEMLVSAEGYIEHKEVVRIPLNDVLIKEITLKTSADLQAEMGQQVAADNPGAAKANEGVAAYNDAVQLYNTKQFAAAMPKFEVSIEHFKEALNDAKEDSLKADAEKNLQTAEKIFAFCLFEVGKSNSEQRSDLWLKAEPILKENFEKVSGEEQAQTAMCLAEIASMRGDTEAEDRYNEVVENIMGPSVEGAYNKGVDLFNAGKTSEAKPQLKRAIEINPEFAETYYLLAICEYTELNLKAAKDNLEKYLKLAPNGKYAVDVKAMLEDPSFRDVK